VKILGIDPGTARMGWGIIETEPRIRMVGSGVFSTVPEEIKKSGYLSDRLLTLHTYLTNKIRSERPDIVVVERLFFNFNVQTAMSVGEGRGVVMLAAAQNKVPVVEYTALTAKLLLAGHGRAEKKQMISAVMKILGLKQLPNHLDDSADALAMALTHWYKLNDLAAPKIEIKPKKKAKLGFDK
jgi:crossover junction endodeoxyribonuclease RuvC